MKSAIRRISATHLSLLAALLIAAFTAACGGGNSSPVIPPTGMYSLASVKGTYAFSMAGEDPAGGPIFRIGSFQADGAGNISAAIEDVNDNGIVESFQFLAAPSSVYTMSSNGKGVLTLAHNDPNTPGTIDVFTFTLALTSTSGGVVIETDGSATMSGTFQLQNITSSFAPAYAFDTSGEDLLIEVGAPESIVGQFTTNGGTGITGGVLDDNDGGAVFNQQVISPGSIVPDPTFFNTFGRGQFQINSNINGQLFGLTFEFYVIDASHLIFVETDTAKSTEGVATAQSNVPANVSQFPGSFVLAVSGAANTGPLTRVGRYTTDGSGNVSAVALDQHINNNSPTVFPASNSSVSAFTYSIDPSGDGRGTLTLTDQKTGDQFIYVFYMASPSQGFIQDESNNVVADGSLNAQTANGISTSSLAGNYAFNWSGSNFSGGQGNEEDFAGVFTDPSGGGMLTNGDLDLAELGAGKIFENVVFSGALTPMGSGTGGGTAGNTLQIVSQEPFSATINFRAYAISNTSFIIVSVDSNRTVIGPLTLQQ